MLVLDYVERRKRLHGATRHQQLRHRGLTDGTRLQPYVLGVPGARSRELSHAVDVLERLPTVGIPHDGMREQRRAQPAQALDARVADPRDRARCRRRRAGAAAGRDRVERRARAAQRRAAEAARGLVDLDRHARAGERLRPRRRSRPRWRASRVHRRPITARSSRSSTSTTCTAARAGAAALAGHAHAPRCCSSASKGCNGGVQTRTSCHGSRRARASRRLGQVEVERVQELDGRARVVHGHVGRHRQQRLGVVEDDAHVGRDEGVGHLLCGIGGTASTPAMMFFSATVSRSPAMP